MNSITLPESLVTQLSSYERRLRRMETLLAVAGGAAGVLATFLLLFASDRFIETPRGVRIVLTLSGGLLAAWFARTWAEHWLWKKRGPAQLAKLLQRHFRTLGDRLQGIIELTETAELPPNISPALLRAAIRQVATESGRFDFDQAVPVRPVRRWALAAGVLTLLVVAPFVFVPKAATNALARWLAPWAKIERYTFVSLEDLPKDLFVPHGEAFEIACGLRPGSAWSPDSATARVKGGEPQRVKLENGRAVFQIPAQTRDARLALRVGDATREIVIHPLHRPEMKALAARVELPDYLGYPAATVPIPGSSAEFLEGSRVSFAGTISRALNEARISTGNDDALARIEDATFVTPAKPLAELGESARFQWADIHRLEPTQPYLLRVSTTKDAEPRVELQGLEPETAILPHEVLKLSFASNDDFGVQEQWLGWTVRALGQKKEEISRGEDAHVPGAQQTKELQTSAEFSPAWQKIPEDTIVELAAYARDYKPERAPVESWKHTVYVLSPAKHAERVRQRMDEMLKQLDERIREEERQLEETKDIAQNTKDLATEPTGEKIKRVEASERANETALQKLTEEMQAVLKDALRNKEIPEGIVADWQQIGERLEQQARPPMQDAAQSLQQAGQQPPDRETQLAQAQAQQQKAIDAMRNAAKTMNTTNQNLYARNFYNRLRAAAGAEVQISDGLKGLAKETVGLSPSEIPEPRKKEFDGVARNQDGTTKDVEGIVNDMAGFLKRVPNEKYETVHKEMLEKRVVGELTELAGFVRANLGLKSVGRAKRWGDQLNEWATALQSECNCQGGGGEMDPDLLELIVAMVRAAQAEDNIREQTQLLDGKKDNDSDRADNATKLAGQQDELQKTVAELREKTKFDEVKPALQAAEGLMSEVADDLREPKTDAEVVSAQGSIIEILVPPDKKGGKSGSKMQQMMRQMLAQATQAKSASGNNSKSSSSFAGEAAEGAAGRNKANARNVEKAGGAADSGEWPEEFRDQLQAYFQRIEAGAK
jgi:hypothetical protein